MTMSFEDRMSNILGCQASEVRYWLDLLGSKVAADGPSDHQAASIGAAVWLRMHTPKSKKQLERFFAKLAFTTDEDVDWWVVRRPRAKEPEIVFEPPHEDLREHNSFASGVVFAKQAFLRELD